MKRLFVILIILLLLIGGGYYLVTNGYIDISQFTSSNAQGNTKTAIVDHEDAINLHPEGNKNSEIIAKIPPETEVTVLEIKGQWARVDFDGTEGWCYNPYLKHQN